MKRRFSYIRKRVLVNGVVYCEGNGNNTTRHVLELGKYDNSCLVCNRRYHHTVGKRIAHEFLSKIELAKAYNNKTDSCELCASPIRELAIDHCHKSKLFRGWLCNHCNSSLGWYEKYKNKIEEYLKRL